MLLTQCSTICENADLLHNVDVEKKPASWTSAVLIRPAIDLIISTMRTPVVRGGADLLSHVFSSIHNSVVTQLQVYSLVGDWKLLGPGVVVNVTAKAHFPLRKFVNKELWLNYLFSARNTSIHFSLYVVFYTYWRQQKVSIIINILAYVLNGYVNNKPKHRLNVKNSTHGPWQIV